MERRENWLRDKLSWSYAQFWGIALSGIEEDAQQRHARLLQLARENPQGAYGSPDMVDDLFCFNTGAAYWEQLMPLAGIQGKHIFDLGCGIGTASLYLALGGNRVTGFDPNPWNIKFARFWAYRHTPDLTFLDHWLEDMASVDLVIAIDVLEHVKDLAQLLVRLSTGLRPGALLYHRDNFLAPHPLHFNHSRQIAGWLAAAGLKPQSECWAIKE